MVGSLGCSELTASRAEEATYWDEGDYCPYPRECTEEADDEDAYRGEEEDKWAESDPAPDEAAEDGYDEQEPWW